jgi:hypothetical protein
MQTALGRTPVKKQFLAQIEKYLLPSTQQAHSQPAINGPDSDLSNIFDLVCDERLFQMTLKRSLFFHQ